MDLVLRCQSELLLPLLHLLCAILSALVMRKRIAGILMPIGFGMMGLISVFQTMAFRSNFSYTMEFVGTLSLMVNFVAWGLIATALFTAIGRMQAAEETAGSDQHSNMTVRCAHCCSLAKPGAVVCPECNKSLRPVVLGVLGALGLIGACWSIVMGAQSLAYKLHNYARFGNPSSAVFVGTLECAIGVGLLLLFWFLLKGSYRAWVGLQIVWAIDFAGSVLTLLALSLDPQAGARDVLTGFGIFLGFRTVVVIPLWIYLYSSRVREYCSAGR